MDDTEVTVGIPVHNLPSSRRRYERILGKPPELEPVSGIVKFNVGGTRLQLEEGPTEQAVWVFRIGVRDLADERTRLERLGIAVSDAQTVLGLIRFFYLQDPDKNRLSFFQLGESPRP